MRGGKAIAARRDALDLELALGVRVVTEFLPRLAALLD
jgi:hypothetical protein